MPNARPSSSATPMAAASIRSRMRWPNRAAERSLSPILLKPDAFARRRRIPSSTFCTGFTRAPRPLFAKLNARPVINSAIELAEWDAFVSANGWSGGCALNVDTGENRLGLSMAEAVQLSARVSFLNHGITLLMSSMASAEKAAIRRASVRLPGSANCAAFIAAFRPRWPAPPPFCSIASLTSIWCARTRRCSG